VRGKQAISSYGENREKPGERKGLAGDINPFSGKARKKNGKTIFLGKESIQAEAKKKTGAKRDPVSFHARRLNKGSRAGGKRKPSATRMNSRGKTL